MIAGMARAEGPVVVELFTSQGCSSCPPADALLAEIAERDDVIAMALHVDYWDYIGWKDEFADPAFTKRQKLYAYAAGTKTIYTPQMVVDGQDHVVGFKPMKLAGLIDRHKARKSPVSIEAKRNGDRVSISANSQMRFAKDAVVAVAVMTDKEVVAIKRGENAGRTIAYHNIVRDLTEVGRWNGSGRFDHSVRVPTDMTAVVLVQMPNGGPIMAAAKLD